MSSTRTNKKEYELTRDFFKLLAENNADRLKPIVQIMKRYSYKDEFSIRLRLNDGAYFYGGVVLEDEAVRKFESNEMENSRSIIKILEFSSNTILKDNIKRKQLMIRDFELLVEDCPIIGKPKRYLGIPEERLALRNEKEEQGALRESNPQSLEREVSGIVDIVMSESSENDLFIVPILSISPHLIQWKIQGVVTDKTEPRNFNNPTGASKVFNFCITDMEGTEIKVSCFGDMVARLDGLIKVSSSYTIKGNNKAVKASDKRYNNTGHEYEITIRNDAVEVIKCEELVPLPPQKINRVSLSKIKIFPGSYVDIVAVVNNMEKAVDVYTGNGVVKRMNIYLIDESSSFVKLTIWGDYCDEFTEDMLHKPIILKGLEVNEFHGKYSLNFVYRSKIIQLNDVGIVKNMLNWYAKERYSIERNNNILPSSMAFGKNVTLHSAIANCLNDKEIRYFNVVGRISKFKKNLIYEACAQKGCLKKVFSQDGQYHCSKCNSTSNNFKYALMATFEISDHSGSHWVAMYDGVAEKLLKKTASEIVNTMEVDGELDGCNMVISSLIGTIHNFNVKCELKSYKEGVVPKWSVVDVKPVNLAKYAEYLRDVCESVGEFCFKNGT
uniref:Replication protein A subunit n=1 Tax=Strongyloides papillosus TaxID=174720 RepID=A0A0N5CGM7_STREA